MGKQQQSKHGPRRKQPADLTRRNLQKTRRDIRTLQRDHLERIVDLQMAVHKLARRMDMLEARLEGGR